MSDLDRTETMSDLDEAINTIIRADNERWRKWDAADLQAQVRLIAGRLLQLGEVDSSDTLYEVASYIGALKARLLAAQEIRTRMEQVIAGRPNDQ